MPPSPSLMAVAQGFTVCAPASSSTVWSGPLVKEGAELMEMMVTVEVAVGLSSAPSLTTQVTMRAVVLGLDELLA